MSRLDRSDALLSFVQDVFINGAVRIIHLQPEDMGQLVQVMGNFKLDFDDAYQYVAAGKNNLAIISFDSDFDHTERGRKAPAEAL